MMEAGIYSFILRHSRRDQVLLVLLSAAALPFLYFSFEVPKIIINEALSAGASFPRLIGGFELGQIGYLLMLSGIFLVLVLINGAFKFFTSTYRYRVGDRLLRRLRYELVERLLRFPVKDFRDQSTGQVVSMVGAETSPLGFFMSEAFTVPTVAAGTLFTILLFIFMQDWMMGLAAIALYPIQLYLIPKLQIRVNDLERRQALAVRGMSDNVGHIITNAAEMHGHDTSQFELAVFSKRLQGIFKLRVSIATARYTINVLNQFFSQLTPFFFLSIGGYLVIRGDISIGSLVAVLAAHKDMYAPFKDLIDYYQKAEDARVKYGQLLEYFCPPALLDRAVIATDSESVTLTNTDLVLTNVVVDTGDGFKPIDGASLRLPLPVHAAFVGGSGSARDEIARLLLRQSVPSVGEVRFGDREVSSLPDSVVGRRIGYAGPDSTLGVGALREMFVYPLLRRPAPGTPYEGIDEAILSGNSTHDPDADWIDYSAARCADREALDHHILHILQIVDLESDVYEWGIRRPQPSLSEQDRERALNARALLRQRLAESHLGEAVEPFEVDRFLERSTISENIIFGTVATDLDKSRRDRLDRHFSDTIEAMGLSGKFVEMGVKISSLMIEMFRNLDPTEEFFQDFSFIRAEELQSYESIIRRIEASGARALADTDRRKLMSLPLKLIASRHTIGLVDDGLRADILRARKKFRDGLPDDLRSAVVFFEDDAVNPSISLYDNLLFGKLLAIRSETLEEVASLTRRTVAEAGLLPAVLRLGLKYDVGIGGARLTSSQRQRLFLGRSLIKRPDILILNDALSAIEPAQQDSIISAIRQFMRDGSLFMIEATDQRIQDIERIFDIAHGRLVSRNGEAPERELSGAAAAETSSGAASGLGATAEVMAQIPLFGGMDRSKLKLLAFTSETVTYAAGDIVFEQGSFGDKAFVILEGDVDVIVEGDGRNTVVARLGRNQLFGEMALLANQPRTTTIRAATPLRLLALRQDVFVRLVEEDAGIALGIVRVLIARLASTLKSVR